MALLHKDLEKELLDKYGGKSNQYLPQSLLFDQVSPATRLLEKRRQMFEVDDALISQKEEFIRREEAFHRREDGIRRKDLDLQESLIKFNKFLRENEAKRIRALKKVEEEIKLSEIKDIEIKELNIQLQHIIQIHDNIKLELDKYITYRDYLDDIVSAGYFHEVSDITNRYKTLKDTNEYLLNKQSSDVQHSDIYRANQLLLRKSKENQVLNNNNKMIEMRYNLEQYSNTNYILQTNLEKNSTIEVQKVLNLGQIFRSIGHIYDRCNHAYAQRHNKYLSTQPGHIDTPTHTTHIHHDKVKKPIDLGMIGTGTGTGISEDVSRLRADILDKLEYIGSHIEDLVEIESEYHAAVKADRARALTLPVL